MKKFLPPKNLAWLLFAALSWLQISCAVKPPDVPVFEHFSQRLATDPNTDHLILVPSPLCMEKIVEFECGHGVFIMSGREVWVGENKENWFNGKPWSQLKRESILVPAVESYAPLSTYIINSCAKNNCDAEVDRFKVKIDELKSVGDAMTRP